MATTITDVLNNWDNLGVFSYMIPFLLIFAVVFAILRKTKLLSGGDDNKAIEAIIAAAVGLLALQLDFVSSFYQVIFPVFGVGLSIFLVLIIILGFFISDLKEMKWIGYVVGIGTVLYAFSWYGSYGPGFGGGFFFGGWFNENFWALVMLAVIGLVIYAVAGSGKKK